MSVVAFHGASHFLSNFHPSRFVVDGEEYACVEQFMQVEKARAFGDHLSRAAILKASAPLAMKRLGRKVEPFDKEKWSEMAPEVVRAALRAKFGQGAELRARLLGTGDALLVEASPRDRLWGAGLGRAGVERVVAQGG